MADNALAGVANKTKETGNSLAHLVYISNKRLDRRIQKRRHAILLDHETKSVAFAIDTLGQGCQSPEHNHNLLQAAAAGCH